MIPIGEAVTLAWMGLGAGLILGGCIGFAVQFYPIARSIRDQAELAALNEKCSAKLRAIAERNAEVSRGNLAISQDLDRRLALVLQLESQQLHHSPKDPCEAN